MRLYRYISSFRILSNPCNKQGLHSTARHFIPDNTSNASGSSDGKMLDQHKAYEMVKQMSEIDRDNLRCALNQFELDQIKIKFEGKFLRRFFFSIFFIFLSYNHTPENLYQRGKSFCS